MSVLAAKISSPENFLCLSRQDFAVSKREGLEISGRNFQKKLLYEISI